MLYGVKNRLGDMNSEKLSYFEQSFRANDAPKPHPVYASPLRFQGQACSEARPRASGPVGHAESAAQASGFPEFAPPIFCRTTTSDMIL